MEAKIVALLEGGAIDELEALCRSRPKETASSLIKTLLEEPPFDQLHVRRSLGEVRQGNYVHAFNGVLTSLLEATGDEALQFLVAALPDSRWWVFEQAALALANLRSAGIPAVPALLDALGTPDRRLRALDSLAAIGPGADSAVPAIGGYLRDPDAITRSYAVRALGAIGSPESREALREAVNQEIDPDVRVQFQNLLR